MIVFDSLSFQNFLSSGNTPVTIQLNTHKTTLVHGTNGSGKSTILDALCYVLFNKPFRNINLPQLVNSSNKKGLVTEVSFKVGNNEYIVTRGMKPKVFNITINGEVMQSLASDKDNQKYLEQNILRMNLKTFIQVVILGSGNYMPFMQLPAVARRDCIEDFLDIKVFTTMAILAKDRLRSLKERLNDNKGELSNLEYKIDLQKDRIQEIKERSLADVSILQGEIDECLSRREVLETEILRLQQNDRDVLEDVRKLMINSPKKKQKEINNVVIKLDAKLERISKDLKFYTENEKCPTCTQVIDATVKETIIEDTNSQQTKVLEAQTQANTMVSDLNFVIEQIQMKEEEAYKIQQEVYQRQIEVSSVSKEVIAKENKIVAISTSTGLLDKEKGKLISLLEQKDELDNKHVEYVTSAADYEVVVNLLKDSGIKTQIVRKYLPVMNRSVRGFLNYLDFPILFNLDEEFNETVASPMHQNFSYASFSEGQKSRIDLALMFTWREIGKIKNSVSTNILILDEVFSSSLDDVGKENLLAFLRYELDPSQRVLVVDHTLNTAFKEKFDKSVEVTRVKGFSKYN